MSDFIPGLKLNELFFAEVIRPFMAEQYRDVTYSAVRLGSGSDVLGYDTPMSTDHDWGIRQQLFLSEDDFAQLGTTLTEQFRHHFPHTFRGCAVHFGPPDAEGTRLLEEKATGLVDHRVEVATVRRFATSYLTFDPTQEIAVGDWLVTPQQRLLEMTAGQIYHDGLGEVTAVRQKLAWYPHDVWLYLMACQWTRLGQEEHFLGRTGYVGDELGSQLLAGRLVHDIMLLCFLQEKRFAPYPKWFGTAFRELPGYEALHTPLRQTLLAADWQERERHFCTAYEWVARRYNELGLTEWVDPTVRPFFGRPFQVLFAGRFSEALGEAITDENVRKLPIIGSIDQFSDNTDLRESLALHQRLKALYA